MTAINVPMTAEEIAAIDHLIDLELGASQSDRIEEWPHLETLSKTLETLPANPEPTATTAPMNIWVLHISHKHGDSFRTFSDGQKPLDRLASWAREWWEKEGVPGEIPENDGEAVSQYFDNVSERESYTIEETTLDQG